MTIINKKHYTVFTVYLLISTCFAWENLPQIPTGRRTQFVLIEGDGSYRYGYDTGIDSAAKQGADASNQVEGHYFYTAPTGQKIDLKYTAGVQGFVPEGLDTLQNSLGAGAYVPAAIPILPNIGGQGSQDDLSNTGDASYAFSYDAGDSRRQESSDAAGNVQGSYSYSNAAGSHDLSYIAGSRTGFVATGGSLAVPNGLGQAGPGAPAVPLPIIPITPNIGSGASVPGVPIQSTGPNPDGSYSFSYNAGDSTRQESGNANGNVQGSYSFRNEAGNNDLSYIAGAETGFVPTGGSLATPNGLGQAGPGAPALPLPVLPITPNVGAGASVPGVPIQSTGPNPDGSYSFSYNAGDSTRQESGDANGNVQGSYSFRNEAGNNDLAYIAGAETGFVATGGSLATPNGLGNVGPSGAIPAATPNVATLGGAAPEAGDDGDDGSYKGSTPEVGDSGDDGSYKPSTVDAGDSGSDDGSYRPSTIDESGVQVVEDGRYTPSGNEPGDDGDDGSYKPSTVDISPPGNDGSYTPSADENVQGPIGPSTAEAGDDGDDGSYKPSTVDISPPGDDGSYTPSADENGQTPIDNGDIQRTNTQANTGDASYSFSIDTDDYKRQESGDANGNVQGSFSYRNSVGTHDLQFVAGSETGFQPTGGSLSVPPGLTEDQLRAGEAAARAAAGASPPAIGGGGAVFPPVIPINPNVPSTNSLDGSEDDQANTGDASYSFTIDTDDYKRQESSDAAGNVQGSFLYKNAVGTHDLQFVAGSATGFQPTGGSLSVPPGLTEEQLNQGAAIARAGAGAGSGAPLIPVPGGAAGGDQANTGDASYSFTINTDTYQRSESSDATGNVQGTYAYQNSVGNHDLSFVAGSATGFQPTGGSLSIPPGLTEAQLRAGEAAARSVPTGYLPPQAPASRIPIIPAGIPSGIPAAGTPITTYSIGTGSVKTYLPPNDRKKYGYIYDTI
ncbi:collagen alpha-2(I) chain-like isoform X2 [Chrysoperla carnea]|uniref:collagen alpha-2(I) chain-like isoform X2 n=1 Tax=Chrysoperla carnea TaxID=189513 RepID=UPI001D07C195|nr:collagen alpha-2(I) chain-like isoform X2 [Chrysoperla carnea]